MDLKDFLVWVYSGGAIVMCSWIFERWDKFQELDSHMKEYLFFGLAAIFSMISYAVFTYLPVNVLEAMTPYFTILASVFVTVFIGKAFHKVDRKP